MLRREGYRLVLMTAPNEEVAERLARGLVEARLAACVSRVPGVLSTYRWQGEVKQDEEILLIAKSSTTRLEELARWVADVHPYDVPECITFKIAEVERAYATWMGEALS